MCKLDPTIGLTLYSYNDEGLVTSKDHYGYVSGHNDCGLPVGVTPRNIQFEYNDGLNRLTKIDFPVGSNTDDFIYSYDEITSSYPIGRMTGVDFGSGSKKLEYDIYGNQHKTTLSIDSQNYTTEKIFDSMGRVEKVLYPTISGANNLTVRQSFDEAGRLQAIQNDTTNSYFLNNITYNLREELTQMSFGNGALSTRSYDELEKSFRLTNITTTVPTPFAEILTSPLKSFQNSFSSIIQNIDYSYDLVSNVIERDDIQNSFTEIYTFDGLNRLVNADLNGSHQHDFTFDEIGNIISKTVDTGTPVITNYVYQIDRKQALSSVGSDSYSFDPYGNFLNDGVRNYVFDYNNRVTSITKNSQTTNYFYGADGLRVKKVTPTQTSYFIDKFTEIQGSTVLRHIFAGNQRIATFDGSGVVSYNHEDHLGSSNLRTDSSGAVIKAVEYLPYGDKRTQSGSFDMAKNNYTGQYEDVESDLYYYQQRYYNPTLGRFISADPLYSEEMDQRGTDAQELNLYAYTKNNPIKYIDPSGEFKVTFFGGFQASGGVAVGVEGASGSFAEFDISFSGIVVTTGDYSSGGFGAHLGASAGAGAEGGVMFGPKESLAGPYTGIGGSGGFLGTGGADLLISPGGDDGYLFNSGTSFGLSGNVSLGAGGEVHMRVGDGGITNESVIFDSNEFLNNHKNGE